MPLLAGAGAQAPVLAPALGGMQQHLPGVPTSGAHEHPIVAEHAHAAVEHAAQQHPYGAPGTGRGPCCASRPALYQASRLLQNFQRAGRAACILLQKAWQGSLHALTGHACALFRRPHGRCGSARQRRHQQRRPRAGRAAAPQAAQGAPRQAAHRWPPHRRGPPRSRPRGPAAARAGAAAAPRRGRSRRCRCGHQRLACGGHACACPRASPRRAAGAPGCRRGRSSPAGRRSGTGATPCQGARRHW